MASLAHAYPTPGPSRAPTFAARHPADAKFFPIFVGVIWAMMLAGFVPELVQRTLGNPRPYPFIVHVHAVVFFGWLTFLASQVALVRTGNIAWHRRMGLVGAALAIAVTFFGPATALTMQLAHEARQPPQFLAVQLLNTAVFLGLIAAGLAFRRDPAAHKRLMLIGTLALTGAGFGRIVRGLTGAAPPPTLMPMLYIGGNLLMLGIALYDYRTRGRLHPVFLPAAGAFLLAQLAAGILLRTPAWTDFTRALVA